MLSTELTDNTLKAEFAEATLSTEVAEAIDPSDSRDMNDSTVTTENIL